MLPHRFRMLPYRRGHLCLTTLPAHPLTVCMAELTLDSPLQFLKGVGPKKAAAMAQYGLETVADLLEFYPRQYLDRTSVTPIGKLQVDRTVTIIGEVKAHGMLYGRKKRYEVIMQDDSGAVTLLFFAGLRYWERLFKKGMTFAATGRVGFYRGLQMVHPELERLDDESDDMVHAGRIIPVYPQTSELKSVGVNSKMMRTLTTAIFAQLNRSIPDQLPTDERHKLILVHRDDAIRHIHYPVDRDTLEAARRRLAFDELLSYQYMIAKRRHEKEQLTKPQSYAPPGPGLKKFREGLPFEFTSGQVKVLREIFDDLQGERPMARMLQGDVGSGKTVVAIAAALYVAENKLQVAFMAPTEILATQHYENWNETISSLGLTSQLLTAGLKAAQRKKIAAACAAGEIDILFGTHALIYDYVEFENLGLVIIDEQHRFGVRQRGRLYAKGKAPDLLVMTATPIPRTLALTLYGDLDISTIPDRPPGRQPIRTVYRTTDVRDRVYQFVLDEVNKGGQAYIVYPVIERSDALDVESVEDAYKELSATIFRSVMCAMVHGRVKAEERDDILRKFRDGEVKVLFATTVVEVGIDNPNATIMVIEHAERFGLAQLHQLRGRIGRGERQSTLVAMADPPLSDVSRQRLEFFCESLDGFEIAEADLELRGPGELFGTRQSGIPQLKAARLSSDRDLMEQARELLNRLFEHNKLDSDWKGLYSWLEQNARQREEYLAGG